MIAKERYVRMVAKAQPLGKFYPEILPLHWLYFLSELVVNSEGV